MQNHRLHRLKLQITQIILLFMSYGLLVISCNAQESLTITTYYPSPYGSYQELRSQRMAIGDNYFGSNYCWPPDICAYQIDTNADLVVEGNVGIGTTSPTAKLHIAGTPGVDGIRFPDGSVQTTAGGGTLVVTAPNDSRGGNADNEASCSVSCPAGYTAMICQIRTAPTPATCGCVGCDRNEVILAPSSCSAYVDSGTACSWIWCSTQMLCGRVQ